MRCIAFIIAALLCLQATAQKKKPAQAQEKIIFNCIVPVAAAFPGGTNALHKFIGNHFEQPDAVPDSSFCKKGIIKFTIDKTGTACQFEIEECLGYNCDEEIIRILKLTKWKPALSEGKPVNDHRRLPYIIAFEKIKNTNLNTSLQSEPCAPPQMLLAKF